MTETILCICAHSDDQIFGPGGTLAKYAKEGKRVITIVLSFGELSHPHFKEEVIAQTRVKESEDADKVIGGSGVSFYGLREGSFEEDAQKKKIIEKLKKQIKKYNPQKILTHSSDDPHPDHRSTHRIVKNIYDQSGLSCPVFTFDVWTPFSTRKRDATKWVVDISDTFSLKMKALKCFRSQLGFYASVNYIVYVGTLARNFFAGLKYGYKFAEVFYKLR